MVGVPGKSKGCNTCRRRKIACSLEKPQCSKCVKSNRVCEGYVREAIFVVDQATGESTANLPERSHVKTYRRVVPNMRSRKISEPRRKSPHSSSTTSGNSTTVPSPRTDVASAAAFRQQFFCQFLNTFARDADLAATRPAIRAEETTWLVLVPDMPDLTQALDTAILALSTANLGRANNDQNLILESRRIYGQGLKDLQRALWNPKLMHKDETLAACMALGIYETLECPTETRGGWVSHSDGCSQLIQLRGPEAHSKSLGRQLFASYRLTGIIECIHLRRTSYLSGPEWLQITGESRADGSFDQLLDILSLLPGIFEDSDRLKEPAAEDMPALFKVLDRLWEMDASLQKFYDDLEKSGEGPLYWPSPSTLELLPEEANAEKLFPVAFHYRSIGAAASTMLYWMNLLLCWRTTMEIYGRVMKSGHTLVKSDDPSIPPIPYAAQLRPLEHRKDIIILAKQICQSFEFCMQDDKKLQGSGFLLIPLLSATITFKYIPGFPRELRWARAAMEMLSKRGWRISTFLEW